ncbi:MAG: hypothetical protein N2035_00290 [Chthoniobacterales bacterium]|nr:hypothetical protein [Chthoniobacterales bacterium]MCX7712096.1 hypothetical protein [Chthoniobacterales bacterium]
MSASAGDSSLQTGKKYRFIVSSAQEAANAIREKLGPNARVLSVRQIEGEGLDRFLKSPKLEVIAHIPPESVSSQQLPSVSPSHDSGDAALKLPSKDISTSPIPSNNLPLEYPKNIPVSSQLQSSHNLSSSSPPILPQVSEAQSASVSSQNPQTSKVIPPASQKSRGESVLNRILIRAGLPESFLLRFSEDREWRELEELPIANAFPRAVIYLRKAIPQRSIPAATRRVAFFGSPGAGATTALCKQLASEVFLRNRRACVMKLDGDEPNSTEALATYCEALGIPLLRSPAELLEVPAETTVYFDIPGCTNNEKNRSRLRKILTDLAIETRVLVINAAYERQLIQHFYQHSTELAATHVVFTHLDELHHYGKLWEFMLDPGLSPLFGSTGPNLAGDCERDLASFLVRKTLSSATHR